jgi:hypothetical protein
MLSPAGSHRRPRPALIALVAAAGLLAGLLGAASPASAGGEDVYFQVTSGADAGPGSWRAAIAAANAIPDPVSEVVVTFDDGIHVELTGADVVYERPESLVVRGRDATLDGNDQVAALLADDAERVDIEELTFVDGRNDTGDGGAVRLGEGGDLYVYDSAFTGNAAQDGGAIAVGPDGTADLLRTTLRGNEAVGVDDAPGHGGGIFAVDSYVELDRSTATGNGAEGAGGAIDTIDGQTFVDASTLAGNSAGSEGGAIASYDDNLVQVSASTFSANVADSDGGAIFDTDDLTFLSATTFVGNSAPTGAHLSVDQLDVEQSAFVDAAGGGESCALTPSLTDDRHSWDDGSSCDFDPSGTSTTDGGDAQLAPLASNGGPTQTHVPASTSPLVDAGPEEECSQDQDQRGVDRPAGDACDIGAVEAVGPTFTDVGLSHPFWLEVEWMAAEGISEGYLPGPTFRPGAPVTRQAMSAFLYRLAGEPTFADPAVPTFGDVSTGNTFYTEIEWMAAEGISEGTPASPKPLYKPSAAVSRQAMSAFLFRYAGDDLFEPDGQSFTDVSESHPFYEPIAWMADNEISEGYELLNGREYRPSAAVSRQAMSAFMYRYAHNLS